MTNAQNACLALLAATGLTAFALLGGAAVQAAAPPSEPDKASGEHPNRLLRDGLAVDFEMLPLGGTRLTEGEFAEIRFRLTDAGTGQPFTGQSPGAWLDPARIVGGQRDDSMACKSKVSLYLKGRIGAKPMVDLNSYYLLVLNKDPSISVIDPQTSVAGITSTLARIPLKRAPMDWVASTDDKILYVSMPDAGEVAVIDTQTFQVTAVIAAGNTPVRLALQPDERYLWVGNNGGGDGESGVTVIDTHTLEPVKHLATGRGHHEIAFSSDSRHAFVSNRDSGTLSAIEIETLAPVREFKTGPRPLATAYSSLSRAVYVADGQTGTISVIDADTLQLRKVIQAEQGIGPLRFSEDGRYGFALNTLRDRATVIDAGDDEILHQLPVSAEPYQVTFTRAFAYIRGLASPRVSMVDLATLGRDKKPSVLGFDAGPAAPKLAGDLPLAASFTPARDDAAVYVVNPVDNTTYFYMEGMNAPMSSYQNRGHTARAASVIDRSLREVEPGLFSTTVKLPASGNFDVAFMLNQPEIVHCFTAQVQANPELHQQLATPRVKYLLDDTTVVAGDETVVRFRILQGREDTPRTGIADLRLRYFQAPASRRLEIAAREVEPGLYEARLTLDEIGAYYLHVGAASLAMDFGQQPYLSLRVVAQQPTTAAAH